MFKIIACIAIIALVIALFFGFIVTGIHTFFPDIWPMTEKQIDVTEGLCLGFIISTILSPIVLGVIKLSEDDFD